MKEMEKKQKTKNGEDELLTPSHKRKGLVVPADCAPAWDGTLIWGWGMDMEDGIPALMPALTPPAAPPAIPGPA